MKPVKSSIAIAILVFTSAVGAADKHSYKKHQNGLQHRFEYAPVVDARPIYTQVKVSTPQRECWEEPVYHTQNNNPKSAGGMVAGGLLGGIIGNQIGKGRGNKLATAVGVIIGAQIGHEAVNGHVKQNHSTVVEYREHCEVRQQVSYEEVLEGYEVTYNYRGRHYQVEMPYHPGERIKMRIQFSPVI